ncbi:uncharacterized protein MYCFIDRAFT_81945 [Pseudocercospora fijiensis CIRAD86]|uniref:Major facilitator superfamily (MFS) profile domain-containing protein n=1 Tax=Pseudocercospora fijiensis (strain CIRAD86) TaxID=383855 RepID=M2Z877_PSEFD|nr:uncharacterized protein MYCFIDRAFT_81945 [Pseudocercospora fijiensis CIRAD86]EME85985.1 hypothetical protein MYCFIDRAFT_81945 [Pseudocercospora fijiensis CIRAD86]
MTLSEAIASNPGTDTVEETSWTADEERHLVRKLDIRIFPAIIVLFILNFIDRNNFANARLKGLEADLQLSDVECQTCISILLVGYVSCQVPSNTILNQVKRPSLYLCTCAAFFPGCLLLLSRWYTRAEMQLRVTLINADNLATQAFGGLIAAGILGDMEGVHGIRAWRWLFIIEGVLTVGIAFIAYPILTDYPATTRWLSARHFFVPTIKQALGYSTTITLLLTAPPWIFAILVSLPNGWHADRSGERYFHCLWPAIACLVGYAISSSSVNIGARYFSTFLMTTGYASGFVVLAWISNTIPRPPAKRAVAIGMINACGNIGSIPGIYIWRSMDGPYYRVPFWSCFAILGSACAVACVLRQYLARLKSQAGSRREWHD